MPKLDDTEPIEIATGLWWVGFADYEAGFSNNPYLLVDGEEGVLFDPGPGHPLFRDLVLQKIERITRPEYIRYLVVHHQDPDLCGLIPFIERQLHPDLVVIAHPRTSLFLPYYGLRTGILPVGDGDVLEMKSGRRLTFHHAPYLHFAGNMMTYDETTASLFSGDIFAVFDREWRLYADASYVDLARSFLEHYVASKESVLYAYEKMASLRLTRILPQHGGIIEEHLDQFLEMLRDVEPGQLLQELQQRPSPAQVDQLFEAGKTWLGYWLKTEVTATTMDDLMKLALGQGPSTVSLLVDAITAKAREFGVANPLTHSQVHRWDRIWSTQTTHLLDAVRRRFLSRQYGMRFGRGATPSSEILEQGLTAFKTTVAVLFADIRGFTGWSAERAPDEIVKALDRQMELMTRVIHANGGRVNKMLGDGLLAYFPTNRLGDCVVAATQLQRAAKEHDMLPMGVGCDAGEVILGDIGQEARLDYSLIGPAVNFASRMCDRAGGGEVALTQNLLDTLDAERTRTVSETFTSTPIRVRLKPDDPERDAVLLQAR